MLETHWHECWRYTSHHACAVIEIERLQEELAQSILNLEGHKKANLQLKEDLRLEAAAYQQLRDRIIVLGVLYPYLSEYLKGEENEQANYGSRGNAGNETL